MLSTTGEVDIPYQVIMAPKEHSRARDLELEKYHNMQISNGWQEKTIGTADGCFDETFSRIRKSHVRLEVSSLLVTSW